MKLNILSKAQEPADVLRYDYTVIADEGDRNAVMGAALAIKPMMRRAAEDLVRIGQELIAVKDMLPHGQFGVWLDTEFELHPRTARRMMNVAERIGYKIDNLSGLSASVLYELAAEATPEEAVRRVAQLTDSGESLTVKDVRAVVDAVAAPVNGKAVYWQPEAAQPTPNGAHTEPEAPTGPAWADRTLTVEQTVDMIELAQEQRDDCPELAVYRGAGWAIYLADRYGFWPTIDVTRQAISQILRAQRPAATERVVLNQQDTEAVIDRVLTKDFKSDTERLAYLDKAGPNAYAHALRPGVFINGDTFEQARAAMRAEVAGRIAAEQAKAEAEAQRRQEDARVAAVRHDKQTMLYGLNRALAELPEGAEDTYYDLTGTTLYSAARQAIVRAIKELEGTMEAKRV